MSDIDITEALLRHQKWLRKEACGERFVARKFGYRELSDLLNDRRNPANLSGADFRDVIMPCAAFTNLCGADFRGAALTDILYACNMQGADLRGARLGGTWTACLLTDVLTDFDIPEIPQIDAAIVAEIDKRPLSFDMSAWHCGTTHCRAGWATTLAGERGAALQEAVGPCVAGTLIYAKSRPGVGVPDFFDFDDSRVLSEMRAAAKKQCPT